MAADEPIATNQLARLVPFGGLAERHLEGIRSRGRCERLDAGQILFRRGESGSELVYLLQGSVDLTDADFNVASVHADTPRSRHALDDHDPHAVTAVSTSDVLVFLVPKDHVDLVLTWDQAGHYVVTDLTEAGAQADGDWMASLLGSSLFASVPPANIQQLFSRFEEIRRAKGDAVVRQGEQGDYFYVISQGRCRVSRTVGRDGETREVELAELGPGQMFGEDALIGDTPRNATVSMLTDGQLMRLGKEDFQALLQHPVLEYLDHSELAPLQAEQRVMLLDVRLPGEFRQARLPDSRNLPLPVLRENLTRLDPALTYVVTCDGGRRSMLGAYLLNQHGFSARVLRDPPNPPAGAVS